MATFLVVLRHLGGMSPFVSDIRQTIVPGRDTRDGPLPPLLLAMTLVTGLVDAFSYLLLGHVFVANMTGNVVLLGFALVGAPGFSIAASLAALASFALGAVIGGRVGSLLGENRARLVSTAASIQAVFIATAVVLAALSRTPIPAGFRYSLIVVLAITMGIQNAAARKLAVSDLTTTVLTMTITGRWSWFQGRSPSHRRCRDARRCCHRCGTRPQRTRRLSPRHRTDRDSRRRHSESDACQVERTLAPRRAFRVRSRAPLMWVRPGGERAMVLAESPHAEWPLSRPAHGSMSVSKYMIEASYTVDGVKGVLKEGGSGRRAAIEQLIAAAGGTVECFYFVFGEDDVIVVVDLPDNATMAAVSLGVSAAGGASTSVRVLLTPEEIDTAARNTIQYRAPGR